MADWDTSSPGDSDIVSQFPQNERAARAAVETNFGVDHHETDDANVGYHDQMTLIELGAAPANVANTARMYALDQGGVTEVYAKDSAGNAIRFTRAGSLDAFLAGVTTASAARTALGLGTAATEADTKYNHRSNNLSDVANAGTARTNLGLGTAAVQADTRYAHRSNNLSDLANAGTARTNLGLGTAATEADTKYNHRSNNLSDVANAGTARTNLGLGSLAVQNTVNNGDWSGTDLAVANGGTGASNAADARTNLGIGSMATRALTIQNGGSPTGGSDGDVFFIY